MNLRAMQYNRRSIVLLWDRVPYVDHFRVSYVNDFNPRDRATLPPVVPEVYGNACQVQGLEPGQPYSFEVVPVYKTPTTPVVGRIFGVKPLGTYEAACEAATADGGFLFKGEDDAAHIRPSAHMFHYDINIQANGPDAWLDYVNKDGWTIYGRNGFFNNHQAHSHMIVADLGGGSLTARVTQPIDVSLLEEHPITFLCDNDMGPKGRQTFYIFFTDRPHNRLDARPGGTLPNKFGKHVDSSLVSIDPVDGTEVRLTSGQRDGRMVLSLSVWVQGELMLTENIYRGNVWPNVRQIMGVRFRTDGLEVLIDRNYDGDPEVVSTYYLPAGVTWPNQFFHPALTIGSYNQAKINLQWGHNAEGRLIRQRCNGYIWHIGLVVHDGARTLQTLPCECDGTLHPNEEGGIDVHPHHSEIEDPDTAPVVDPLDMMPPHDYLAQWVVPTVLLTRKANTVIKGVPLTIQIEADTRISPNIAATALFLKRIEVWTDEGLVYQEMLEIPAIHYNKTLVLDTKDWALGARPLWAVAYTESGSSGYNYSRALYSSWSRSEREVIVTEPPVLVKGVPVDR